MTAQALRSSGAALLLEGHPGMGKTRLYEAALDQGRAAGMLVLRAAGAELERNLSFGVAAQLLGELLAEHVGPDRDALLRAAPDAIHGLLGGEGPAGGAPQDLSISHALFTLIAATSESGPVLVAVDDLHWCDVASMQFLLYLLHRIDELQVALVMTSRPMVPDDLRDLVDRISTQPRVRTEALRSLGPEAVAEMARAALGHRATREVIEACRQTTNGNPLYLRELLLALGEEPGLEDEALVRRAIELVPGAVARAVRVRVGRLGDDAAALARAVAVLGEDVPLRQAAALAGLSVDAAAAVANRLADVEVLLAREPLRYVHPLVRHAIERDVAPTEQASRHLDAARLLDAEGAEPERVAAHLLLGRAEGDDWVVAQLRAAAAQATARGALHSAINYLARALEEPPSRQQRSDVLAELGTAEAQLGLADADRHLGEAVAASFDPLRRAELLHERGAALYRQGSFVEAADAFTAALDELGPEDDKPGTRELHDALQTGYVAATALVPQLRAESTERSAALLARAQSGPRTHGQRLLLAQAAQRAAFAGTPSGRVRELADRAWDAGRMLENETATGVGWGIVAMALNLSGQFERSIELLECVMEDARRRGAPLAFATASYERALPLLGQGNIIAACADIERTLDAERYGWHQFARAAAAIYALCLLELGDLERAESALRVEEPAGRASDLQDAVALTVRAELRLAQGRAEDALEDALASRRVLGEANVLTAFTPWQAIAAAAWLALDDTERAAALAQESLRLAERIDVAHERVRALRLIGLCNRDGGGLHTLGEAVALGRSGPQRLETIRALIDYGAALRRANRRAEARHPLQQAADMARAGGATLLLERARTELSASGARPRRDAFLSGPGSLTPSERRIAQLAAAGQTNREIASGLFVTPKTVEYHLRNAYRKLDIETRRELAEALTTT